MDTNHWARKVKETQHPLIILYIHSRMTNYLYRNTQPANNTTVLPLHLPRSLFQGRRNGILFQEHRLSFSMPGLKRRDATPVAQYYINFVPGSKVRGPIQAT